MPAKNAKPVAEVTEDQIRQALEGSASAAPGGADAAFNPAEFARKVTVIAKIAQPVLKIVAETNWANPIAAATALVGLYNLFKPTVVPAA